MKYVIPTIAILLSLVAAFLIGRHELRAHQVPVITLPPQVVLAQVVVPKPKPKKQNYRPMGATFCKQTGKVYFHKRLDKEMPEGKYLEVGIEFHMRSGEMWAQMFTFTCELRWGTNFRITRRKSINIILGGAEGTEQSLLFKLMWAGKDTKGKKYPYTYNCSCTHSPMRGQRVAKSNFIPPE